MRYLLHLTVTAVLLTGILPGCGSVGDDYQAANRLTVTEVTDLDGSTAPVFFALEETDDSGPDGDVSTVDDNNPGFPDEGESVLTEISLEKGTVEVLNEPRLGVETGVDLYVFRYDVTYLDFFGRSHDFAPTISKTITKRVPSGETVSFEIELVPVEMKIDGLRDLFLFGTSEEKEAVRQWTIIVDVYARDHLNSDTVHAQGSVTVRFINPLVEGDAQ